MGNDIVQQVHIQILGRDIAVRVFTVQYHAMDILGLENMETTLGWCRALIGYNCNVIWSGREGYESNISLVLYGLGIGGIWDMPIGFTARQGDR